jgi:hypothetical protein
VSTQPERSTADRIAELAEAALLEVLENGTTSQKILVLPLAIPRPLPEQRKPEKGGFASIYLLSEIDPDTGEPVTRELLADEIPSFRKHEPGPDGVVSYP